MRLATPPTLQRMRLVSRRGTAHVGKRSVGRLVVVARSGARGWRLGFGIRAGRREPEPCSRARLQSMHLATPPTLQRVRLLFWRRVAHSAERSVGRLVIVARSGSRGWRLGFGIRAGRRRTRALPTRAAVELAPGEVTCLTAFEHSPFGEGQPIVASAALAVFTVVPISPKKGSDSPPNGIRSPSIDRPARTVWPHRALFLRAPQHHITFASSPEYALLTMPPRRRPERDACRTEVL